MKRSSVILITLVLGCAAVMPSFRLKTVPRSEQKAAIEDLAKNWQSYDVYSDGPVNSTSALIFDPKEDGRRLLGYQYVRVETARNLRAALTWIDYYIQFDPRLYKVFDETGAFYGYVFIALHSPSPRRVDEKTLMLPKHISPLHWGGGEGD